MISINVLLQRIDGLEQADLVRWIENKWVVADQEAGQFVFQDIDVARIHLIYELREDMDVPEAALPICAVAARPVVRSAPPLAANR